MNLSLSFGLGASRPSEVLFARDTFTDTAGTALTSHTPELGGSWVAGFGFTSTPHLISTDGRIYTNGANGTYFANALNPVSNNSWVQRDLTWLSLVANHSVGVTLRHAAGANTQYLARWTNASNRWELLRIVAGVATTVGFSASPAFSSGTKTLYLSCAGEGAANPVLVVKVDGVSIITFTDSDASKITAAGYAGIRDTVAASSTTGIHGDNFKAGVL